MARGKNPLSAFAINLINIDDNQVSRGKRKVNIVKSFCKRFIYIKTRKRKWKCSD